MLYPPLQMEYCEKSTLRDTIDQGLHQDNSRLWRLFREILDGLAYIHQQVCVCLRGADVCVCSNISNIPLKSLREAVQCLLQAVGQISDGL